MKKWLITLLLFLLLLGCKTGELQPGPEKETPSEKEPQEMVKPESENAMLIKDLIIDELGEDIHSLSFKLQNTKNSPAECSVKIMISGEQEVTKDVGMVKANSEEKKQVDLAIKDGDVKIEVRPVCKWNGYFAGQACTQKDAAEKKICELTFGKPELKQCLDTNTTYYQFFCIALITENQETCDEIESFAKKNWCKAYVAKDSSLCDNIQDLSDRDWCYSDLGMNFRDESTCAKISDTKSRISCTAVATQNPEMCLQGSEELKLSCIANLAEATGKKELCNLLDSEQKQECIEQLK